MTNLKLYIREIEYYARCKFLYGDTDYLYFRNIERQCLRVKTSEMTVFEKDIEEVLEAVEIIPYTDFLANMQDIYNIYFTDFEEQRSLEPLVIECQINRKEMKLLLK